MYPQQVVHYHIIKNCSTRHEQKGTRVKWLRIKSQTNGAQSLRIRGTESLCNISEQLNSDIFFFFECKSLLNQKVFQPLFIQKLVLKCLSSSLFQTESRPLHLFCYQTIFSEVKSYVLFLCLMQKYNNGKKTQSLSITNLEMKLPCPKPSAWTLLYRG